MGCGAVELGVVLSCNQVVLDELRDLAVPELGGGIDERGPGAVAVVVLGVGNKLATIGDDADSGVDEVHVSLLIIFCAFLARF